MDNICFDIIVFMLNHGIIQRTKTSIGEDVWVIFKDGAFDDPMIEWQQSLYGQDRSPNTVRAGAYDLTKLWDFQYEYGSDYDFLDPSSTLKMLRHFKQALLKGDERLGWSPLKKTSVKRILNSVNSYMDFSVPDLSNPLVLSTSLRFKKNNTGFFAHLREPILKQSFRRLVRVKLTESNWDGKYFPFANIKELIYGEPSARNRCLYALLAMGGLRLSEALNLWIDDISFERDVIVVKVNDPEKRRTELWKKYRILPDPDIRNKGRANDEVFFLDGGDAFMEAFERYIFNERPPTEEHPYLFVNLKNGKYYGNRLKPHSVREAFSKRCIELGVEGYSPHSLRHFYGVYAVNVIELTTR